MPIDTGLVSGELSITMDWKDTSTVGTMILRLLSWRYLFFLMIWPGVLGCGSDGKSSVVGTITNSAGQPLVGARVTVRSDETGKWASGVTDKEGTFSLGTIEANEGLVPGQYGVIVVENRGSDSDHPLPRTISTKYGNPATSGISLTVETGKEAELSVKLDPP